MKDGHLFGAGIDVFSKEPPVGNPQLQIENTVMTSHLAGATLENFVSIVERGVENAKRVLRGEPLPTADVVISSDHIQPVD